MKNKFKLDILLLTAALLISYTSMAMAFSGEINACNGGDCHALSTAIQVSGNVTSTLTVNPDQPFTLNISWSGGSTTTNTVAKWPSNFTNIGITRDNVLFHPDPIASPTAVNPSGTLISTLTAPAAIGSYIVRVYTSTAAPKITNFMDINISVQQPVTPQAQTFNISGFKLRSTDNTAVPNWSITLTNDTLNTTATTDANGMYQFTGLSNGAYNVTEGTMTGWTPVGETTLPVTILDADVQNQNFTNTPPVTPPPTEMGSISGFKINDINGNGEQDSCEDGLSGWTIELRGIGPETHKIKKETTTDSNGYYEFDNLPAGKYIVKEKHMKGFIPTSSPVIVVSLEKGMDSTDNNFMNMPKCSLMRRGDDNTE